MNMNNKYRGILLALGCVLFSGCASDDPCNTPTWLSAVMAVAQSTVGNHGTGNGIDAQTNYNNNMAQLDPTAQCNR
jgi:hypothetical protein